MMRAKELMDLVRNEIKRAKLGDTLDDMIRGDLLTALFDSESSIDGEEKNENLKKKEEAQKRIQKQIEELAKLNSN